MCHSALSHYAKSHSVEYHSADCHSVIPLGISELQVIRVSTISFLTAASYWHLSAKKCLKL
jgi:hypothetical protein